MTVAAEVTITEESDYLLTSGYATSQSAATASGGNGILRARENPFGDGLSAALSEAQITETPHLVRDPDLPAVQSWNYVSRDYEKKVFSVTSFAARWA